MKKYALFKDGKRAKNWTGDSFWWDDEFGPWKEAIQEGRVELKRKYRRENGKNIGYDDLTLKKGYTIKEIEE